MPNRILTLCLAHILPTSAPSVGSATLTILIPSQSGNKVVTVKPKEWKIGNEFKITSSLWKLSNSLTCLMLVSKFLWLMSMPFGSPSLPLLNKITAVSFKRISSKCINLIHHAGANNAVSIAFTFSPLVNCFAISSACNNLPAKTSSKQKPFAFNLLRNFSAEITCSISALASAFAITSGLSV